jgi:drug/metabolite transporter (DMT)-like permease
MKFTRTRVTDTHLNTKLAYLLLFIGVSGISSAAVLIRLTNAPALIIASYRMVISALIILVIAVFRHSFYRINWQEKEVMLSFLSGIILALHFWSWISSLKYTSVSSSTIIVTTQPIFVILGSWLLFDEKISLRSIGYLSLAFAGSALIGYADTYLGDQVLLGDGLAFIGAVTFAGYLILGKIIRKKMDIWTYAGISYSSSALMLIMLSIGTSTANYAITTNDLLIFTMLALLSTVVGHTIFNWLIKYIGATTVSISILGEPIGATILAAIILKEYPNITQIAGGIIVIFGVAMFLKTQTINKS